MIVTTSLIVSFMAPTTVLLPVYFETVNFLTEIAYLLNQGWQPTDELIVINFNVEKKKKRKKSIILG